MDKLLLLYNIVDLLLCIFYYIYYCVCLHLEYAAGLCSLNLNSEEKGDLYYIWVVLRKHGHGGVTHFESAEIAWVE